MDIVANIRRALGGRGGDATGRVRRPAGRVLDVPSGYNVRELGGYQTASGTTERHRYLRSGDTDALTDDDVRYLLDYGVTHVLDLRGAFESPARTCRFARRPDVAWLNVPLFDYDVSDPQLVAATPNHDDYLVDSYLTMLANRGAVRRVFRFFAKANADGPTCTLFHCAAGMDRTGMTALLLLGLAGADRRTIVTDYAYSFGDVDEVDAVVHAHLDGGATEEAGGQLVGRIRTVEAVYGALVDAYGGVRDYLLACDLTANELDVVVASLVA